MTAAHRGPQAGGCKANCWTFKSLYRRAKKLGADLTYAGAARAFKERGLRSKIPRPETPCDEPRGAHRPPKEGKVGAGGGRQGRARDRIRGREPRAGAQERACDGVVQGRAAGPQAERGARPPDPVRSRGRGISVVKEGDSIDAKRRLAAREGHAGAGKARMFDGGAGRREPTCPRRAQAKAPADRGGRGHSRTRPTTALPSRRCAPSSPRHPTTRSTAPAPCTAGSGGASRRARTSRRRSKSALVPARRGSPPAGRAPSKGG